MFFFSIFFQKCLFFENRLLHGIKVGCFFEDNSCSAWKFVVFFRRSSPTWHTTPAWYKHCKHILSCHAHLCNKGSWIVHCRLACSVGWHVVEIKVIVQPFDHTLDAVVRVVGTSVLLQSTHQETVPIVVQSLLVHVINHRLKKKK